MVSAFLHLTFTSLSFEDKFVAFAKRGFEKHNDFRSVHHSPPLKWSDRLAEEAQKIAYKMALKGTLQVLSVSLFIVIQLVRFRLECALSFEVT